jgi:hypothetical protein
MNRQTKQRLRNSDVKKAPVSFDRHVLCDLQPGRIPRSGRGVGCEPAAADQPVRRQRLLPGVGNLLSDLLGGLLAGKTAQSDPNCSEPALGTPFATVGDYSDYFLVPGGNFNGTASGWQLNGATAQRRYLSIAEGGTAITVPFCVGAQDPTFRMVLRDSTAEASDQLNVYALFVGLGGQLREDSVTSFFSTGGQVQVTPVSQLSVNYRAGAVDQTQIALVFTAQSGNWEIAAPYIDPFRSN